MFRDLFLCADDVFDGGFVTAVDSHIPQSHSSLQLPLADLSIVENMHIIIKGTELFSYFYFLKHRRGCCLSLLFVT